MLRVLFAKFITRSMSDAIWVAPYVWWAVSWSAFVIFLCVQCRIFNGQTSKRHVLLSPKQRKESIVKSKPKNITKRAHSKNRGRTNRKYMVQICCRLHLGMMLQTDVHRRGMCHRAAKSPEPTIHSGRNYLCRQQTTLKETYFYEKQQKDPPLGKVHQ